MGFDEANIPHYVLYGEIFAQNAGATDQEKNLVIEKQETPQPYMYRRLSGTLVEIKQALQQLATETSKKPLYLELYYKREIGINAQEYLNDVIQPLPEYVSVVSWKIMEQEKSLANNSGFEQFDATEIKNLDDTEIFTQLILTKSGLDANSQEGKHAVQTFLPLFMQLAQQ